MATIHVDGKAYEVDGANNLLHACLSLGLDIPYFCWHPAMDSIGACRQCAVKQYKDKDDTQGELVMSCMTPSTDNSWISIDDEEAKTFRSEVVEWLMTYHPHDCPVCEEGGHCHLQDVTVMTGHSRRRYDFRKRTHRNQYLGPFVAHEMNRCINCYRCVRFYNDYAGGTDLGVFGSNNNLYFGRHQEGVLESPFAGNLTEVCPTGVFTDQTHSDRYVRKWDMQFAPSVCHQCAVGCNISPGERYGEIRRIENRYHGELNRYFLCDRGRFGYGYVNRTDRPRQPEWRSERRSDDHGERADEIVILEVDPALDRGADLLRNARRVIGIGSPRASLESNHQLIELVGRDNFSNGIVAAELACLERMAELETSCGLPIPTLREVEAHDAVLVLGEDMLHSAARLALAVRQAVLALRDALAEERGIPTWNAEAVKTLAQDSRHPLYIAYPNATELDGISADNWQLAPADIARLGFAIAHIIDGNAPAVPGLDAALAAAAQTVAKQLIAAERPLVISGGSLESTQVLDAAGSIARALSRRTKRAGLMLIRREANSTGLTMLGGRPLEWALDEIVEGRADALVVLENDLYVRLPEARVDAALNTATALVVLDHQRTRTWQRARLGLAAASFTEADGTLVNLEGRAQRFYQVFDTSYMRPESRIHQSWRWLHALRISLIRGEDSTITLDEATEACAQDYPALADIVASSLSADYRVKGVKLARAPHRFSGRTSLRANIAVSEPRTPQDPDTPFNFSMEGYSGFDRPRKEVPFAWAPGWNSHQAWNKFTDEVGGHLRGGDPGVRLVAPRPGAYRYASDIPAAFEPQQDRWQLLVLPRLFGGEETSSRSAPIEERAERPTIGLSSADAARRGFEQGASLTLETETACLTLPLRCDQRLPSGIVSLPAGISSEFSSGDWARLEASGPDYKEARE
ncbi:NADH-quinone oxidoreductase subunit NuoG [Marinobacter sp. ELB17]|uniref:NADH-quinone oxidoreductase subunit NuoG n=1 Tax=Marinobacter sp. ELB17 TaxID=270374 RepID=UPI0000F39B6E|nr:NADH-quinone oxidoreductase subunit NuoG [Marinobacter sp. ELB17]EAZ99728.1 NADH dehydrogenase subunit G [Marinobacter sp. ELB17]